MNVLIEAKNITTKLYSLQQSTLPLNLMHNNRLTQFLQKPLSKHDFVANYHIKNVLLWKTQMGTKPSNSPLQGNDALIKRETIRTMDNRSIREPIDSVMCSNSSYGQPLKTGSPHQRAIN
uniref:Uncharacterized protein n=1 Tax=Glossina austeni TaxID=7395 RepID=A0A1A9UPK2_GLOAU